MPLWVQHVLVVVLVCGCVGVVAQQLVQTFRGRKGTKLGSCCASGCPTATPPTSAKPATERVAFLPVEMLGRR